MLKILSLSTSCFCNLWFAWFIRWPPDYILKIATKVLVKLWNSIGISVSTCTTLCTFGKEEAKTVSDHVYVWDWTHVEEFTSITGCFLNIYHEKCRSNFENLLNNKILVSYTKSVTQIETTLERCKLASRITEKCEVLFAERPSTLIWDIQTQNKTNLRNSSRILQHTTWGKEKRTSEPKWLSLRCPLLLRKDACLPTLKLRIWVLKPMDWATTSILDKTTFAGFCVRKRVWWCFIESCKSSIHISLI